MVHLNIDSDLEATVRALSVNAEYPIGTVASALMRLGLLAKPADLRAMLEKCRRLVGRPPANAPSIGIDLANAKKEPKDHGWSMSDKDRKGKHRVKSPGTKVSDR